MMLPQRVRGAHTLVGAGGGHPDIGEHDVGELGVDGGQQLVEIAARTHHLDAVLGLEQAHDALAHEVAIFGNDHSDRHRRRGYGACGPAGRFKRGRRTTLLAGDDHFDGPPEPGAGLRRRAPDGVDVVVAAGRGMVEQRQPAGPAALGQLERVIDGRVAVEVGDRALVREELGVVHEQVDPRAFLRDRGMTSRAAGSGRGCTRSRPSRR